MTTSDYEEFDRLSVEAFDRTQPAHDQKAKLLRFKELADKFGQTFVVEFYWGASRPEPAMTHDILQAEFDHIEWRLKAGY